VQDALGHMKGGFVSEADEPVPDYVIDILGPGATWCEDCSAWHPADFDHDNIPETLPVSVQAPSYTGARELHVDGADVGLITCNLCGCSLILDEADVVSATEIHDRWHHNGN
jgi:hypothetical protein